MKNMMGRSYIHTVSATLVALALFCLVDRAAAFPIPERLEFELSYSGITAGHAVQEVKQEGAETHIVSTAKSADWLRFFFPVDDRIESYLVSGAPPLFIGSPRLYQERKHEGKTITNREARFDRQKLEVTMIDHRNKEEKKAHYYKTNLRHPFQFFLLPYDTVTGRHILFYRHVRLQPALEHRSKSAAPGRARHPSGTLQNHSDPAAAEIGGDFRPNRRYVHLADR